MLVALRALPPSPLQQAYLALYGVIGAWLAGDYRQPPTIVDPATPIRRSHACAAEHLQRVYFRLQQADYFARNTGEDAKQLPELARKFYERALQAYDRRDWRAADEFAKSADDTIRGLENLAQAAIPPPRSR